MSEQYNSLISEERINVLISEAELELNKIQPEIDYLEGCITKLNELKIKKNKLLILSGSLKSILKQNNANYVISHNDINTEVISKEKDVKSSLTFQDDTTKYNNSSLNIFKSEVALENVKSYLRPNNNLNYELFKAVVFYGGEASTEQIKEYLIKNSIKQPKTGKSFENVDLKDISSRVNYLVRKKLLFSTGPGLFKSTLGYK